MQKHAFDIGTLKLAFFTSSSPAASAERNLATACRVRAQALPNSTVRLLTRSRSVHPAAEYFCRAGCKLTKQLTEGKGGALAGAEGVRGHIVYARCLSAAVEVNQEVCRINFHFFYLAVAFIQKGIPRAKGD